MWADVECDGRPAKCRWRPLLSVAVWLTPTAQVPCSKAANTILGRKVNFATCKNCYRGKRPRKYCNNERYPSTSF